MELPISTVVILVSKLIARDGKFTESGDITLYNRISKEVGSTTGYDIVDVGFFEDKSIYDVSDTYCGSATAGYYVIVRKDSGIAVNINGNVKYYRRLVRTTKSFWIPNGEEDDSRPRHRGVMAIEILQPSQHDACPPEEDFGLEEIDWSAEITNMGSKCTNNVSDLLGMEESSLFMPSNDFTTSVRYHLSSTQFKPTKAPIDLTNDVIDTVLTKGLSDNMFNFKDNSSDNPFAYGINLYHIMTSNPLNMQWAKGVASINFIELQHVHCAYRDGKCTEFNGIRHYHYLIGLFSGRGSGITKRERRLLLRVALRHSDCGACRVNASRNLAPSKCVKCDGMLRVKSIDNQRYMRNCFKYLLKYQEPRHRNLFCVLWRTLLTYLK